MKSVPGVPNVADPELSKLPVAPPVPVKEPISVIGVSARLVSPEPEAAPVPAPDPSPPAVPKKLVALAMPPPKFVALPLMDPTALPTGTVAEIDASVPSVVPAMLRFPLPLPKPPVGPVETGVTVVMKVGGPTPPPELPPFLELLNVAGMGEPGTSVTTVLNATGLKPAPKPPAPEEVVSPPKLASETPPSVMPTDPICSPVAPPAELPVAEPNTVLIKPELPLVLVKSAFPLAPASATLSVTTVSSVIVSPDPVTLALPPPLDVPEMIPPVKGGVLIGNTNCNFLDPLRLR
jgi:hypothetical protein